jgi:serine/threonine protein kinase
MKQIPDWKIIRTIGKGSFGTVYEVEKEDGFGGGIRSALKVISIPESSSEIADLRNEGYDGESMTELFRSRVEDITAEFRLMNKLKGCSNIVSFEDYSIVQHDSDPGYDVLIRMELLTSLPDFYRQNFENNEMPDKVVCKLGADICNALIRCRKESIIHRDIKPQNIFVNKNGDFKLGDFGIAKTSDHTTKATKTGTNGYMAPEVYLGKPYGASVDCYSLGLVMYWMLNERRGPFLPLPPAVPKPKQSEEALSRRMQGEQIPPPKYGSEELKRIVLKACAFNMVDRYSSVLDLKKDLRDLINEDEGTQFITDYDTDENPNGGAVVTGALDEDTWETFPDLPGIITLDANLDELENTRPAPQKGTKGKDTDPDDSGNKGGDFEGQTETDVIPEKDDLNSKHDDEDKKKKRNKKRRIFICIAAILAALIIALIIILALNCNTCRTDAPGAEVPTITAAAETDTPVPSQEAQLIVTATPIAEPSIEATPTPSPEPTATPTPTPKPRQTPTPTPIQYITVSWTEETPPANAKNIQTKTQYRYRDKQTTTSASSFLDGWTQSGSHNEWGDWSNWSETAVSDSSTVQVETRMIYILYHFRCSNCGYDMPYYGSGHACWYCGQYAVEESSYDEYWQQTPYDQLTIAETYSSKMKVEIDRVGWYFNTKDYHTHTPNGGYIRQQYRSRELTVLYDFLRWTDWSGWSDEAVNSSSSREVETKTLYQYQVPQ